MMYSLILGYNTLTTHDDKIKDFYEYCISRRVNTKTQCAWNGHTKVIINDILLYLKKNDIPEDIYLVSEGLQCYSEEYGYDEEFGCIRKGKYEYWVKIDNEYTDDFPQEN